MSLGDSELERYARHIVLKEIGGAGQARLKKATVAVIGAGGIGSPAIQYIAAAGVGRLRIIDDDHVDTSNLQRQTIYTTHDVGKGKAAAAVVASMRINPHVDAMAISQRIDATNAARLIGGADVVLDGCDNFATRLAVGDVAQAARIPLVSAALAQFEGQLAVYRGWEGGRPCYRCLVGDSPGRAGASCADDGILGPAAGILGSMAALEVIRALVPFGDDPVGTLLIADLMSLRFRSLRLGRDPACSGHRDGPTGERDMCH